jgi:hypothetical protein
MKELFLIPAFLLIYTSAALGQVKVGIKAGGSYNSILFADTPNIQDVFTERYGYLGGIISTVPITEKFYGRPELLLLARGWKDLDANDKLNKIDLKYLSLPLVFGYRINPNFSVLLGPEVNYLLNSNYRENYIINIKDDHYNRFEIGLNGGIAYQFLNNFTIEARYSRGLTTLVKQIREDDYTWGVDANYFGGINRSLQLNLAYQLNVK